MTLRTAVLVVTPADLQRADLRRVVGWPVRAVFNHAGLPIKEPFRRMRRTFATEMGMRVPSVFVTRWLGHAEFTTKDQHYVTRFPMGFQRDLIRALESPAGPEALRARFTALTPGPSWEPRITRKDELAQ
ncbi:MAG: hypothetical protein U0167_03125 [bacterium]